MVADQQLSAVCVISSPLSHPLAETGKAEIQQRNQEARIGEPGKVCRRLVSNVPAGRINIFHNDIVSAPRGIDTNGSRRCGDADGIQKQRIRQC